jgi:hypothetical protein
MVAWRERGRCGRWVRSRSFAVTVRVMKANFLTIGSWLVAHRVPAVRDCDFESTSSPGYQDDKRHMGRAMVAGNQPLRRSPAHLFPGRTIAFPTYSIYDLWGRKVQCRNGVALWRRRFSGETQRRLWRRQLVCDTAAAGGAIVLAPEYSPIDRCHGYTADCPRQAGGVGSAGAKTSMAPLTSRTSNCGSGLGAMGSWWASTCPVGENDVE